MDRKVLEQLQKLEKTVTKIASTMVTNRDLKRELAKYATKDDLKNFATKDDLKAMKDDLKKEIHDSERKLKQKINETEMRLVELVDKHKADKTQVNDLQRRVTGIEGQLQNL